MFKKLFKYFKKHNKEHQTSYCRRCGRRLTTEYSKKLGLGRCCYQKELLNSYTKKLF